MSELKDRIEYLFSASLMAEPVIHPLGLSALFKNEVDLATSMRIHRVEGSTRFKFRNESLCELTEEFGVVALSNAFVHSNNPNLDLSGTSPDVTLYVQDPFHRDPLEGVTLLQKYRDAPREIPTYYAFADEVRKSIAKLNRRYLSEEICAALDLMQGDDYMFSLEGLELELRELLQYDMRGFSESVFSLIPEDRKFEKSWMSNQCEVVTHSNRPNYIVHGRPASNSGAVNNLSGIHVQP